MGNSNNGSGASLWRRLWMNPGLSWGCEIAPTGVSAVRWDGAASQARWRPLPENAIDASPLRENLLRPDEVRQALLSCLESLGRSGGAGAADAALVIPDPAARVFFLSFDALPRRPSQAIPLIRWKLKKSVPFDIDTATVSYVAEQNAQEWHVLAVVSPEAIVRQYEEMLASLGLQARFLTLSTLGSLGLVSVSQSGAPADSVLLAKYSAPSLTMTIVRQGTVRLFRTVTMTTSEPAASAPQISVREILEALYPSVAYFQDTFGVPLQQAYLCGLGEHTGAVADSLLNDLGLRARPLLEGSSSLPSGWDAPQADQYLAALAGIARERRKP